jgi:hypothetical protein
MRKIITLQMVIGAVYIAYVIASFTLAKERELEDFSKLSAQSEFHSVAVEAFTSCRMKLLAGTRDECFVTAKQAVEIRGLSGSFDLLLHDIEEILTKADQGRYHLNNGRYVLLRYL